MISHLVHWFLSFIGVYNGESQFSTRMYNFWSGFGGNISILALIGTVFGVYRHNLKRLEVMNPLHFVQHLNDQIKDQKPKDKV